MSATEAACRRLMASAGVVGRDAHSGSRSKRIEYLLRSTLPAEQPIEFCVMYSELKSLRSTTTSIRSTNCDLPPYLVVKHRLTSPLAARAARQTRSS
jgi:hypothetical protein